MIILKKVQTVYKGYQQKTQEDKELKCSSQKSELPFKVKYNLIGSASGLYLSFARMFSKWGPTTVARSTFDLTVPSEREHAQDHYLKINCNF